MTRHARIELRPADDTGLRVATSEDGQTVEVIIPPSQRMHYLCLVAGNGQVLATSETYANRTNARRAVKSWLTAFAEVWNFRLTAATVQEFDADGNQVRP